MADSRYQFINLTYLDDMCDGDTDMKITLIEMLLEELETDIKQLKTFAQNGSWKETAALSHRLKTTISYTGNAILSTLILNIENSSKQGINLSNIPELILLMEDTIKGVLPELKNELQIIQNNSFLT
ncbi:MAG: hypothetical protein KA010_02885 [Saprospiraceae bacterium]|nr:hypothetical protein [Saprospiraceae bacterium]